MCFCFFAPRCAYNTLEPEKQTTAHRELSSPFSAPSAHGITVPRLPTDPAHRPTVHKYHTTHRGTYTVTQRINTLCYTNLRHTVRAILSTTTQIKME